MLLNKLKLTNFRNFSKVEVDFSLTTLFLGKNAQGKSNLLESIYFLATTKSSRVEKEGQLIKYGEGYARAEGVIQEDEGLTELEIFLEASPDNNFNAGKRVKVNGVSRRVVDYLGNLVAVYFSPEDINLVGGSPSLRRLYLDLTLAQIDKPYKKALAGYSATLTARNRLLKRINEGLAKYNELDFWTAQLLEHGQILSEKRRRFFEFLNNQDIFPHSLGEFHYIYQKNILNPSRLNEYKTKEVEACTTLIGPHRDDFVFEMNGRNLAYFGSRGEQRTTVLELKLSTLNFIRATKEITPVLLLDDIFSELDTMHRDYIVSLLKNQQTIITAIEDEQIPESLLAVAQVFKVEQGKVK